jgi:cobalt-zinc-cadmium efflux system protein
MKHHHPKPSDDDHGHAHDHRALGRARLRLAIIVTAIGMALEVVGGLISGSLALVSDAGHMFTHLFALGVSYLALAWSERPATGDKSFGYYRGEVLAALLNGLTVLAVVAFIVYEAVSAIITPHPVKTTEMLVVAGIGLVVNLVTALLLLKAGRHDLNIKSALVHLVGDLGSSVAVVAGGVVMIYTGFWLLDPILSLGIAAVILVWSWGLIRESVHILLQGTPREVDLPAVRELLASYPCVTGVEDLHVWCVTSRMHVLTAQLRVPGAMRVEEGTALRRDLTRELYDRFQIVHATLELAPTGECEPADCALCRKRGE